jgi:formylglycine-generating enzyme
MRLFLIFTTCAMLLAGFGCGDDELDPRTNPFDPQNPDTGGDPFGLTVTPEPQDPRTFVLTWIEPEGVDFDVYLIYWKKNDGIEQPLKEIRAADIQKLPNGKIQDRHKPPEGGHTYTYRVGLAREVEGQPREESPLSKITGNTTQYLNALPMVTTIHPPVIEGNTAKITWDGKDDDGEVKSYRYELSGTDQKGSGAEPHHDFAKLREGEYTIRVWATDDVGHEGPEAKLTFNFTVKWGESVQINGGTAYTADPGVMLTVSAKHGTEVRVSNTDDFAREKWEEFQPEIKEIKWNLFKEPGTKTVYVQFRDDVRNTSKTFSASIFLLEKQLTSRVDNAPMALIPAGEFRMGDHSPNREGRADERPPHPVFLDDFYIDVHEVTVGQYKRFIQEKGHRALPQSVSQYSPNDEHPVVFVSWEDANAYAEWAGKRLPTEAEWEKAARGELVDKRYPWGDEPPLQGHANYNGRDRYPFTAPVKTFQPNGYGLYNIAGNVWEWCADGYRRDYYTGAPQRNPKGPPSTSTDPRVCRGGGWDHSSSNLRVAKRFFLPPQRKREDVGFRCAADISDVVR